MQYSKNCVDLVKKFEGCHLKGYLCPAGVPTIGYGHTGLVNGKKITTSTVITQAQAEAFLKAELDKFAAHVNKFKYTWNQNEFDALVSFAYNVGSINQLTANGTRTKAQIAAKIPAYNKAGGKVLAGLTRRRMEERTLFLKPVVTVKPAAKEEYKVEQIKMIVDGKEVTVRRILKDGTNYIAIRDVGNALGLKVGANGNIPVLSK